MDIKNLQSNPSKLFISVSGLPTNPVRFSNGLANLIGLDSYLSFAENIPGSKNYNKSLKAGLYLVVTNKETTGFTQLVRNSKSQQNTMLSKDSKAVRELIDKHAPSYDSFMRLYTNGEAWTNGDLTFYYLDSEASSPHLTKKSKKKVLKNKKITTSKASSFKKINSKGRRLKRDEILYIAGLIENKYPKYNLKEISKKINSSYDQVKLVNKKMKSQTQGLFA